jgi:hypothetical protein
MNAPHKLFKAKLGKKPSIVLTATLLLLSHVPAWASIIVDTTNAVIQSTLISGITADGSLIEIQIGDDVPGNVYDPADFPTIADPNGLTAAVASALVQLFNSRGVQQGVFSGCEPADCTIFLPQAYDSASREYYSFVNVGWRNGWLTDQGGLTDTWPSAGGSSVTLGLIVRLPTGSMFGPFILIALLFFALRIRRRD